MQYKSIQFTSLYLYLMCGHGLQGFCQSAIIVI